MLMPRFHTSDCPPPTLGIKAYAQNCALLLKILSLCLKSGRKIICNENNVATHKKLSFEASDKGRDGKINIKMFFNEMSYGRMRWFNKRVMYQAFVLIVINFVP
jgi:hypothetical protein